MCGFQYNVCIVIIVYIGLRNYNVIMEIVKINHIMRMQNIILKIKSNTENDQK